MALISSTGSVTARIQLDAWGQVRQQSGADPGIQFQGYLKDAESPNLFAFARRYSNATGTFLSADPVAGDERLPVAQNLYLGFHGNPTIYLDPDGRTEQLRQLVNNFSELHESSYQRIDVLKAELARTQNPVSKYLISTAITREFALNAGLMVGEGVTLGADILSDAGIYGLNRHIGVESGAEYSNSAIADVSDAIGRVGSVVSDSPLAVTASVHAGYVEQVSRAVFDNDSRSQAQLLPDLIDLVKQPLKGLDDAVARSVAAKSDTIVLGEIGDGIGAAVKQKKPIPPEVLARWKKGTDFNNEQYGAYEHREIAIESPNGGPHVFLDSYSPGAGKGEIVSRKFTQLSEINPDTAMNYLRELARKYPAQAKIANTAGTRASGLAGRKLEGQMILEVPPQTGDVPKDVLDMARKLDIKIRDSNRNIL